MMYFHLGMTNIMVMVPPIYTVKRSDLNSYTGHCREDFTGGFFENLFHMYVYDQYCRSWFSNDQVINTLSLKSEFSLCKPAITIIITQRKEITV